MSTEALEWCIDHAEGWLAVTLTYDKDKDTVGQARAELAALEADRTRPWEEFAPGHTVRIVDTSSNGHYECTCRWIGSNAFEHKREVLKAGGAQFKFAHTCQDGHQKIGYNDGQCPLHNDALAAPTPQVSPDCPDCLGTGGTWIDRKDPRNPTYGMDNDKDVYEPCGTCGGIAAPQVPPKEATQTDAQPQSINQEQDRLEAMIQDLQIKLEHTTLTITELKRLLRWALAFVPSVCATSLDANYKPQGYRCAFCRVFNGANASIIHETDCPYEAARKASQ